ncbi:hypothetical protein N9118_08100 [Akkermansiaceae bacterium]|nr:hypothetical protein [Akkermansiaceae bacterium]
MNNLKNFKLSDLRKKTPPIVEIEKDSLKELKSDREQALAFHRSSRKSRNTPAIGEFLHPIILMRAHSPPQRTSPHLDSFRLFILPEFPA